MEDSEWFYLFLSPLYDFDEKKIVLRYRQAWSQSHPETHDRPTTDPRHLTRVNLFFLLL